MNSGLKFVIKNFANYLEPSIVINKIYPVILTCQSIFLVKEEINIILYG
jgi:hypothetical protein